MKNKLFNVSSFVTNVTCLIIVINLNSICVESIKNSTYKPIVLWHGMGDSCCFPFSIGGIRKKLQETLPDVYIVSIKLGKNLVEDVENGYFMHPDKQIDTVCAQIQNDGNLINGFNAIGFSQGSQFLRGLVQKCSNIQVHNLISIGGQHQGIYGLPNCLSLEHKTCDYFRKLLNAAAYYRYVQEFLVQATYWHDPLHESTYKRYSTFLSDINNEQKINSTYIERLKNVNKFVMVKFDNDSIVQPIETEWFGFYTPGQSEILETLQESNIYKKDRLGLKVMDENNQLKFLSVPGNHLQFHWDWFHENIIVPFLINND